MTQQCIAWGGAHSSEGIVPARMIQVARNCSRHATKTLMPGKSGAASLDKNTSAMMNRLAARQAREMKMAATRKSLRQARQTLACVDAAERVQDETHLARAATCGLAPASMLFSFISDQFMPLILREDSARRRASESRGSVWETSLARPVLCTAHHARRRCAPLATLGTHMMNAIVVPISGSQAYPTAPEDRPGWLHVRVGLSAQRT